ncbi:hypothetical protein PF006_g33674, partial [Phytophthora fragariae]
YEDAADVIVHALLFDTVQPERPIIPDLRFCLWEHSNADSELLVRFDVSGVLALCRHFGLPEIMMTDQRDKAHCSEALCILLYRLSYSKRLYDMIKVFGRSTGQISRLFRHMVLYIYDRYKDLIYFQHRICSERIHMYAAAIRGKGSPMS